MDNLRFWPPDKRPAFVSFWSSKLSLVNIDDISWGISLWGTDLKLQKRFKCSSTVNSGNNMSSWGHIPISLRKSEIFFDERIFLEL